MLLHLSDEAYDGGYDIYRNFRGVFRNYWSATFDRPGVLQFPLGYSAGFGREQVELGTEQRSKLWSFLGGADKSSRPEMTQALMPLTPNLVHSTELGGLQPMSPLSYTQILRDSVFVPCPMGNVNLDSFRVYEALQCGAIPILERRTTLDYFTRMMGSHPLPTFADWSQAARFIAALRYDHKALNSLQMACFNWWVDYKKGCVLRWSFSLQLPQRKNPTASRTGFARFPAGNLPNCSAIRRYIPSHAVSACSASGCWASTACARASASRFGQRQPGQRALSAVFLGSLPNASITIPGVSTSGSTRGAPCPGT